MCIVIHLEVVLDDTGMGSIVIYYIAMKRYLSSYGSSIHITSPLSYELVVRESHLEVLATCLGFTIAIPRPSFRTCVHY